MKEKIWKIIISMLAVFSISANVSASPKKYEKDRVYIGSAYTAKLHDGSAQEIVDAWDSAGVFFVGDLEIVADHNYQGFCSLEYNNTGVYKGQKIMILC